MPSPFAETYTSPAAVPFAANVEPFLLTPFIKDPVPTKIDRHKDRKTVPRTKLPLIVTPKPISKL
jgi:hypothetical protein